MSDPLIDSVKIHFDAGALWVLNMSLALVMFGIALEISPKDFRQLAKAPRPVLTGVVSQFLLLPFMTYLVVLFLAPYPSLALGMFLVAACPGGNVSNFITQLAGGNTALSVSLTALATLLAIVVTPINFHFWGSLYAPTALLLREVAIPSASMIQLVALLLGVPLLLGMMVNALRPQLARGMAGWFRKGSLLLFVLLVFLALYDNRDVFVSYVWYVFWLVLVHNAIALMSGYSFARLLRNNKGNARSIAIETGIQNSGLGLLLIFSFFDGLGGMALLAAFWGIWHLVSGLLLAGFWGSRSTNKNTVT